MESYPEGGEPLDVVCKEYGISDYEDIELLSYYKNNLEQANFSGLREEKLWLASFNVKDKSPIINWTDELPFNRNRKIYKGYGEYVDAVPINELTISIFREARPEKMFLTLQKYGHKIEEKYPGIYYVTEHLPFPAQIIVTQELEPGEHRSLRILSNHAKKEDVEEFLRKAEEMNTKKTPKE